MAEKTKAEELALMQKEISVSEFFAKNRHLLGFDNPRKALIMAVKEGVDNSLDASQEARILPEIYVEVKQLKENKFRIVIEDNGPGIVKEQIPKIFGKLLYGSKFHRLKMARGQQGLGISAVLLYGQLTTGKGMHIQSKISSKHQAHYFEVQIDTKKNEPIIAEDKVIEWLNKDHGIKIEFELEGVYQKGKQSIDEYLKETALVNPHATINYKDPEGKLTTFPRAVNELPKEIAASNFLVLITIIIFDTILAQIVFLNGQLFFAQMLMFGVGGIAISLQRIIMDPRFIKLK